MYTENNRHELLVKILEFVKGNSEFVCLLMMGSGVNGFTDIYSDIDLMIGCKDEVSVELANIKLVDFFNKCGAIYLDYRKWTTSVLGISAYFENGISVDISFMAFNNIPIRSKSWSFLWVIDEMNGEIKNLLSSKTKELSTNDNLINQEYHHKFFYKLRVAEIAILRKNYIYADIAINEARQMLLLVETIIENKKTHQFKAFNTLNHDFLNELEKTYPKKLNEIELTKVKDFLLSMYVNLVDKNNVCKIDESHFKIINCF